MPEAIERRVLLKAFSSNNSRRGGDAMLRKEAKQKTLKAEGSKKACLFQPSAFSLKLLSRFNRHRPQKFGFPLIHRHPLDHIAHGAHDQLFLAGLEEIDRVQRLLDVLVQQLEQR